MKTRRIHLQPGECAEVVNQYGTSILKVTAMFDSDQACAVIYEQPGAITLTQAESKQLDLAPLPLYDQFPIEEDHS